MKHGVQPATPDEKYEMHWYFETVNDHDKKDLYGAIFTEGAPDETINGFIENLKALFDKTEARFADGRAHVAGASITAADYFLLSQYTQVVINPNLRNPAIHNALEAYVHPQQNNMRVINAIKAELQTHVDALNF